MAYYKSNYTGEQIDDAVGKVLDLEQAPAASATINVVSSNDKPAIVVDTEFKADSQNPVANSTLNAFKSEVEDGMARANSLAIGSGTSQGTGLVNAQMIDVALSSAGNAHLNVASIVANGTNLGNEIASHTSAISTINGTLSSHTSAINTINSTIRKPTEALVQGQTLVGAILANESKINTETRRATQKENELQTSINNLYNASANLSVNSIVANGTNLGNELSALNTSLASTDEDIAALQDIVNDIRFNGNTNIKVATATVGGIDVGAKLSSLEEEKASATALATTDNNVADNASAIASLRSDVTEIDGKVNLNTQEIVSLRQNKATKEALATTDSNVAALQTYTTSNEALETDAKSLHGAINELKAQADNTDAIAERNALAMGSYAPMPPITLTPVQSGYVVNASGTKVAKSGWAMAEFTAEKGNEYLFKPNITDANVAIFAEKITRKEVRIIDYTDTYNEDGTLATSTATYNGTTYTYTYEYSEEGYCTIKLNGQVVSALPTSYTTTVGTYQPLTVLNAQSLLPQDGKCRFISHFKGNTAITVVVSYKVGVADLNMQVLRDGAFANISTQLGNQSTQIDKLNAELIEARNEADVARRELDELRKHVAYADDSHLPTLCGQPSILFGHGTPQASVAPDNWIGYRDGGYEWNGLPSALGQQYINLDAAANGRYIAVPNGYLELKWLNC